MKVELKNAITTHTIDIELLLNSYAPVVTLGLCTMYIYAAYRRRVNYVRCPGVYDILIGSFHTADI